MAALVAHLSKTLTIQTHTHTHARPFQCLDEHLNLILQHATERRTVRERAGQEGTVARQQTREMGLVMLPGKHVVTVEVKERDPLEIPRGGGGEEGPQA